MAALTRTIPPKQPKAAAPAAPVDPAVAAHEYLKTLPRMVANIWLDDLELALWERSMKSRDRLTLRALQAIRILRRENHQHEEGRLSDERLILDMLRRWANAPAEAKPQPEQLRRSA